MLKALDHRALPVAGFTTPWIASPGVELTVHVSADRVIGQPKIVRLDTPGTFMVDWPVQSTEVDATLNRLSTGSWLRIAQDTLAAIGQPHALTLEFLLTRNTGVRRLLDWGVLVLEITDQTLALWVEGKCLMAAAVPSGVWMTLRLDLTAAEILLAIDVHDSMDGRRIEHRIAESGAKARGADIAFGSDVNQTLPTLNARYGRIGLVADAGAVGWAFPTTLTLGRLPSTSGLPGIPLEIVNLPTFCVRSCRWDGSSFDPRHVPTQYDAIHCHDDDMHHFDWPATARVAIPSDAPSGIYACEIPFDGGRERIVFFVSAIKPQSPLLFIVPTATYLAYANEALPEHLYPWVAEDKAHRFAQQNGLRSLYDYHNDLSGVSITTNLKPMPTLREDYIYPLCGSPHNLPVDLHLLRFLHRNGIAFDLMTDHDLHARGVTALAGYRGVLTGSHPEYVSLEMDQHLRTFLAAGGSLAYLGGNGFAGTVAFQDDLMELRRSPLEPSRTWDGPVSEQHLALTNQPGGYLRDHGKGEFSLIGGAISLMGFDAGRPFKRTQESYAHSVAWLFDGVQSDVFGTDGIVLNGAASYEVDATNVRMGTSPDTVVIARADGFPDSFCHDASRWYPDGEVEKRRHRCAEMTLRHLPSGGVIFSASSVGWCGALPEDDTMNDVGRITLNLINRILTCQKQDPHQP